MALVNNHPNEAKYVSKQNSSSQDLSSPENYGLDQPDAAYAGGGGHSASSSSTMNSDQQQNHQGIVFYPSGESVEDHNSLLDFNGSSFLNFDHNDDRHESFPPPTVSCGGVSGGFSFLEGNNMSYSFTNWNQHHMDIIGPRHIETPGTNQVHKDWSYSDSTVVTTGSRHKSVSPKSTGNKRSYTVSIKVKHFEYFWYDNILGQEPTNTRIFCEFFSMNRERAVNHPQRNPLPAQKGKLSLSQQLHRKIHKA